MGIFVHKTKDAVYYNFEWQADNMFTNLAKKALKNKQAIKFNDNFYLKLNRHYYNSKPCGEYIKDSYTSGYCYLYALLLARDMKDATLVHGGLRALCSGEMYAPFEHAWVELGDLCFDTTSRQVFKKEMYYKLYMPEIYKEYTFEELKDNKLVYLLGLKAIMLREEKTVWFEKNFDYIYEKNKDDKTFVKKVEEYFNNNKEIKKYYENAKYNSEKTL